MFSERSANTILVIAALTITVSVALREVGARQGGDPRPVVPRLEFQADWPVYADLGVEVGTAGAPTLLMIFNDFECGGCRLFHDRMMGRLRERKDLSIRLIHKPLRGHRFAMVAARAAECGDLQHRGQATVDALFAKQDSLGVKPWGSFGIEAGIPDLPAFLACVNGDEPLPRITAGLELADRLKITGTPTLMIGGWLVRGLPSEEQFLAALDSVGAGRPPAFQ